MKAILDTNFVIACIRRRIDFLTDLKAQGFRVVVPREVIEEMKDIRKDVAHDEKVAIDLALQLFEKEKVEKMKLPKGKVDEGLILLGKDGNYIATLDTAIRKIIPNLIGIANASNSVSIERK